LLVYQNVCDFCGNCKQILKNDNQISFSYFSEPLAERVEDEAKRSYRKTILEEGTFCSRDCIVEFIKKNIDVDGNMNERDDKLAEFDVRV